MHKTDTWWRRASFFLDGNRDAYVRLRNDSLEVWRGSDVTGVGGITAASPSFAPYRILCDCSDSLEVWRTGDITGVGGITAASPSFAPYRILCDCVAILSSYGEEVMSPV
ncbi:hypothetical protein J6590_046108 [Homalodisca vitripennis]|nr:hypothetical protein J6590_046108 [Homalodisca vitripennis]